MDDSSRPGARCCDEVAVDRSDDDVFRSVETCWLTDVAQCLQWYLVWHWLDVATRSTTVAASSSNHTNAHLCIHHITTHNTPAQLTVYNV